MFIYTYDFFNVCIKIHCTINEELNGRWQGPDYYTLGWPEILAVGEGPVDGSKSKVNGKPSHVSKTWQLNCCDVYYF